MKKLILFAVMLAAATSTQAQTTLKVQPSVHDTTFVVRFSIESGEERIFVCNKIKFSEKDELFTLTKITEEGVKVERYIRLDQFKKIEAKVN